MRIYRRTFCSAETKWRLLRDYLDYNVRMMEMEMMEKLKSEQRHQHVLSRRELERRGLAMFRLTLDPRYIDDVSDGDVRIRLLRQSSGVNVQSGFQRGKLATLIPDLQRGVYNEYIHQKLTPSSVENQVDVIVDDVGERDLYLTITNFTGSLYLLNGFRNSNSEHRFYLVKRSERDLYFKSIQRLKSLYKSITTGISDESLDLALALASDNHIPRITKSKKQTPFVFDDSLDESKLTALRECSQCPSFHIIHGPPGTGKTTTLASVILSAVLNGDRVLALAPSHAACDSLTEAIYHQIRLIPESIRTRNDIVLIRHAKRQRLTRPFLVRFLPEHVYSSYSSAKDQNRLAETWKSLADKREEISNNQFLLESILSDFKVIQDSKWTLLRKAEREASIFVTTIASASVVEMYNKSKFDLVCIDEAGFVSQGNSLLHIMKASRLILCGDHCQLPPPTCPESLDYGISAMEKLARKCPSTLLTTQYRSNSVICEWSSKKFYDGKLISHPTVADSTLSDLLSDNFEFKPLIFIDTSDCGFDEGENDQDGLMEESVVNHDEAFLVEFVVTKYLEVGVPQKAIGVITPYWAQVVAIRDLLWENHGFTDIGVHTVDSYQGSEKEMIILSLVRSNSNKDIGFLNEIRRMNVSLTRAKRCLVMIGNGDCLSSSNADLKTLIDHCRHNGYTINANRYLDWRNNYM